MTFLSVLIAALAAATPADAGNVFVNGRVSRQLSGTIEIYEPWLRVNQWASPWGGGASVSGTPLQGNMSRTGDFLRFFGSGVDADAHRFGDRWRVNGTIRRAGQNQIPFSFEMQISGRIDDPEVLPHFDVWNRDANLRLTPSGGRDYSLSGWVDSARFGPEGVALVGLVAAMTLDRHSARGDGGPRSAPDRVYRVLPFPALPLKP